jgi:hypothetical protein
MTNVTPIPVTCEATSFWAGMTLAVPGATGFVAPAQRAVIVMSGSCHRPGSGTFYGRMLAAVLSSGWR